MELLLSLGFLEGLCDDQVVGLEGRKLTMWFSGDDWLGDVTGAPSNLSYEATCGVCWGTSGGPFSLKIY